VAWGPLIERHARFPQRVNAGFMQIVNRGQSGCASMSAVPARPWPAARAPARPWWPASAGAARCARVDVHTRGGLLTIEWDGGAVRMTGPAELFLKARSTFLTTMNSLTDTAMTEETIADYLQKTRISSSATPRCCGVQLDQRPRPARRQPAGAPGRDAAREDQGSGAPHHGHGAPQQRERLHRQQDSPGPMPWSRCRTCATAHALTASLQHV
jgi:hypothetical protein